MMDKSTLTNHVLHVSFAVLTAVNRKFWSYGMCTASLGTWFPTFRRKIVHLSSRVMLSMKNVFEDEDNALL